MTKKKRIRKDIEKLLRSGRYWDLLRLMESEGIASANSPEYREAWKGAIEQALWHESAFDRFCREVATLKALPDTPDFRFLMRLKSFIEGRGSAEEVLRTKGLSIAADRLRAGFQAYQGSSAQQEKLRALLEKFIREPLLITRRHFEQAVAMIPAPALAGLVEHIGNQIPIVRRINRKDAAARGWGSVPIAHLNAADDLLSALSGHLPPALRKILFHPFTANIALFLKTMGPQLSGIQVSTLALAIPFLLPLAAGEKFHEVERKFLINREDWLETAARDLDALDRRVTGLGLEEKLSMLRTLRLQAQHHASTGPNFDRPDFEDMDFFDDEEFSEEEEPVELGLNRAVLLLHRSVLKDIADRAATISPREKKELVRVMEPILFQDFDYILDSIEDPGEFLDLLVSAMNAGCAGTRMGLTALLAGARYKKNDLRRRAEKHLDQSPPPTPEDMEWLAKDWAHWYYPSIRALKPLLNRYRNDPALLEPLTLELCSMTEFALIETSLQTELMDMPGLPEDLRHLAAKPEEPGILRRELVSLTEYEALEPLRCFLKCYPKDRFTVEGNLCWLNTLHARADGVWDFALSEIRRYNSFKTTSRAIGPVKTFKKLLSEKVDAMWLFLKEHAEELSKIPVETLAPLLTELLALTRSLLAHHTFLIRLEKLLIARVETGDKTVLPVADKIRQTLMTLARKGAKFAGLKPETPQKKRR